MHQHHPSRCRRDRDITLASPRRPHRNAAQSPEAAVAAAPPPRAATNGSRPLEPPAHGSGLESTGSSSRIPETGAPSSCTSPAPRPPGPPSPPSSWTESSPPPAASRTDPAPGTPDPAANTPDPSFRANVAGGSMTGGHTRRPHLPGRMEGKAPPPPSPCSRGPPGVALRRRRGEGELGTVVRRRWVVPPVPPAGGDLDSGFVSVSHCHTHINKLLPDEQRHKEKCLSGSAHRVAEVQLKA